MRTLIFIALLALTVFAARDAVKTDTIGSVRVAKGASFVQTGARQEESTIQVGDIESEDLVALPPCNPNSDEKSSRNQEASASIATAEDVQDIASEAQNSVADNVVIPDAIAEASASNSDVAPVILTTDPIELQIINAQGEEETVTLEIQPVDAVITDEDGNEQETAVLPPQVPVEVTHEDGEQDTIFLPSTVLEAIGETATVDSEGALTFELPTDIAVVATNEDGDVITGAIQEQDIEVSSEAEIATAIAITSTGNTEDGETYTIETDNGDVQIELQTDDVPQEVVENWANDEVAQIDQENIEDFATGEATLLEPEVPKAIGGDSIPPQWLQDLEVSNDYSSIDGADPRTWGPGYYDDESDDQEDNEDDHSSQEQEETIQVEDIESEDLAVLPPCNPNSFVQVQKNIRRARA